MTSAVPPYNASEIRAALLTVAGRDKYRQFLVALNGPCQAKGRLYFWQELLWGKAQERLGIRVSNFKEVSALFRICHVHDVELQQDRVPVVYGTYQVTGSYIEAMEASFPYANDVFHGPCREEREKARQVLFCSLCRTEKKRWESLTASR